MGARLDQHFLINQEVVDTIIAAARINPSDRIVEIGPGRGVLTQKLISRAAQVVAVEMDDGLAPQLAEQFSGDPRLRVIHSDFLKLDLSLLGQDPVKLIANLPYSVATPILQRLLLWPFWTDAVLMFQKEVAERITAGPGSGDYGLLTLSVLLHARAEMVVEVPRQCFSPRPKVDSAVVRLIRREKPLLLGKSQENFFRIAKAAFGQRRKMASGPIAHALCLPRQKVAEALSRCGVSPACRAQEISLEVYLRLPAELGCQSGKKAAGEI